MSSLSETLESVRATITKVRGKKKNLSEEDTKVALINPVLCALGWPVGNLDEVSLEFRLKSSNNPVDYALLLAGSPIPILLVEAKALGESLDKCAEQIMGYAGVCGVTWVVVTNGDEYRIYNASVPVPFEQKLFRRVNLTNPADPAEETLALLSKARIDDLAVRWQIHFVDSQVHAAIEKLFSHDVESRSLLVSFVKKCVKELTPKHLTLAEIRASLSRLHTSITFRPHSVGEKGGVSRASWETDATPETVALADRLLKLIHAFAPSMELTFNKAYLGLVQDGRPNTFVVFEPQKKAVSMDVRIAKSDDLEKEMKKKGIGYTRTKDDSYNFRLLPADVEKHSQFLTDIMRKAFDERMKGK